MLSCLRVCGIDMDIPSLIALGRDILQEKYQFKFREGFSLEPENLRLPARVTEQISGKGKITEEEIRKGVEVYHSLITR